MLLVAVIGVPVVGVASANSKFALTWDSLFVIPTLTNLACLWLTRFKPYAVLAGRRPKEGTWLARTADRTPKTFLMEVAGLVVVLALLGFMLE